MSYMEIVAILILFWNFLNTLVMARSFFNYSLILGYIVVFSIFFAKFVNTLVVSCSPQSCLNHCLLFGYLTGFCQRDVGSLCTCSMRQPIYF